MTIWRSVCSLVVCMAVISGCASNAEQSVQQEEAIKVTVLTPKSPALVSTMLASTLNDEVVSMEVKTWDTIEQLLAVVQDGEIPFVIAPLNIGANAYAQGLPLQLVDVNTWGAMYLISLSPDVDELADLEGEAVYIPGRGGPPDLLTDYLLSKDQISEEVERVYAAVPEIMQLLASGEASHAVLPEPVLSGLRAQSDHLTEVLDYDAVWQQMFGGSLPQAGLFVQREWAAQHPEAVQAVHAKYTEAVARIEQDAAEAVQLSAELFGMPEEVLTQAMQRLPLQVMQASEARAEVEQYFSILLEASPDSIGGQLPDEGFYYQFE